MFKSFSYSSVTIQKIYDSPIVNPSVIWTVNGKKKIISGEKTYKINVGEVFFTNGSRKFSFENVPKDNVFFSRQISFLVPPERDLINLSQGVGGMFFGDVVMDLTDDLKQIFNIMHGINSSFYSHDVRLKFIGVIYMLLAEKGVLHILFPINQNSFDKKIKTYFSNTPGFKHNIDNTCVNFSVSRSTLIRRLNKKNIKFKFLLREVRMNHAVHLIKNRIVDIDELTFECGYVSKHIFQKHFKEQFGITFKEYVSTLDVNID